jgi:diketogulonate reductase-like aldo/keto reductase
MAASAALAAAVALSAASQPCVVLKNAAAPGVCMPAIGVGTGGYAGTNPFYGSWPENWNECIEDPTCATPDPPGAAGNSYCQSAISTWLTLGGRRIDTSASYRNQRGVGQAINAHRRVNRSDVFVTSKVGPYLAMGYDEVKAQVASMLDAGGLGSYVDLVLVRSLISRGEANSTSSLSHLRPFRYLSLLPSSFADPLAVVRAGRRLQCEHYGAVLPERHRVV